MECLVPSPQENWKLNITNENTSEFKQDALVYLSVALALTGICFSFFHVRLVITDHSSCSVIFLKKIEFQMHCDGSEVIVHLDEIYT